jgi:AbrB family looped-hinge helix DNA binding protein
MRFLLGRSMRITSKGQVTIPQRIRQQLGLHPNTEVVFEVEGNAARIKKARGAGARGRTLVSNLKGRGTVRMSTDEILALTRR